MKYLLIIFKNSNKLFDERNKMKEINKNYLSFFRRTSKKILANFPTKKIISSLIRKIYHFWLSSLYWLLVWLEILPSNHLGTELQVVSAQNHSEAI